MTVIIVLFCVVRGVHKFALGVSQTHHSGKKAMWLCLWQDLYVFPDRCCKCAGTQPTLCRSPAFSWAKDGTY